MSRTVAMRSPRTPRQPGVAILSPRPERTQIQPAIAAGSAGKTFADDLATFAAALNKNTSMLLSMMSGELSERAKARADELRAMSSADRRASVARAFTPANDAARRVRAVLTDAGPLLRREIFSQLPPWLRVDVVDLVRQTPTEPVPPLVKALASRLIRESTR